ncbi:hypothetical protein BASA60_000760 [Batrachochytrium salamandrivorans]|nr:hypothetical protein BASA62_004309 [Batrachochytrium salamandrivorans]KAH6584920.1 hypothetical protein BASA60_000760 [Batrachochytrium salamandrivorans]KAH9253098.1 hypothetical protein BASA81_008932 [Batrachochytrium salamandrivorans]KAH9263984.1 hypothetical protein BASA83_012566 [Batrachochytrium salamandrivorans]
MSSQSETAEAAVVTPIKRVLVSRLLPPMAQRRVDALSQRLDIVQWKSSASAMPRNDLLQSVAGMNGIMVMVGDMIDEELLQHAGSSLTVVSTMSAGCDHIDFEAARTRSIRVCNTPDVLTDATAEIAVGLVLSVARRFNEGQAAVRNAQWGVWNPVWLCGMQLPGKTVGIVGLGRIGLAVAKRLIPFQIGRVIYCGTRDKPDVASQINAEFMEIDMLLSQSDVVVVCCALTAHTRHMFDQRKFSLMKSTAIFINISRGGIVDQDALVEALRTGVISGAGLDVTDPEPISPDHALVTELHHKCVILPHIGSAALEAREAMANLAIDNLLAGI